MVIDYLHTVITSHCGNDKSRQVFIATSIPVDITVDYIWDWKHLTDLLCYLEITQGVVPFFPEHFIKATERDITMNGAKKEIIRLNKVLSLMSTYINVCTLFKYKHADSRKAANVLIAN